MIETMLEKLIQQFYLPRLKKLEAGVGCKLVFHNIPNRYIDGWVSCSMTKTWRKFGLNIEQGGNYFTIGHVVNGDSSRFDRDSSEYQSWLGGYTLRLATKAQWTIRDHFKLAIADQNSWLRWYGDRHPMTSIEGWKFTAIGPIQAGKYSGHLYEGGCTTHSDVGKGYNSLKLYLASFEMAALFNLSNPRLNLKPGALRPRQRKIVHKTLKLKGYIAIFNIKENVKVVFYGNGALVHKQGTDIDTFEILKNDLLTAIESCDIVTT